MQTVHRENSAQLPSELLLIHFCSWRQGVQGATDPVQEYDTDHFLLPGSSCQN